MHHAKEEMMIGSEMITAGLNLNSLGQTLASGCKGTKRRREKMANHG
jgi:hypothetical protein